MNLVTGATGIVGSHVVLALLQNNQTVIACKQKNSSLSNVEKLFAYYTSDYKQLFEKIKWIELDVRDISSIEDALEGINTVYHCAGIVSFSKKDRKKLIAINEIGTANIVNACLSKKINSLCYVSSISTINNLDYILPLNEDVFWKKSGKESDYAVSKYNAEREVWRGIEEGLNAVIVNPGVILSPGFWNQSSSKLFNYCYKGNKYYTVGTAAYIAATDVASIMLDLVSKKQFSNRYILLENNYSFQNIFNLIQTNLNKPPTRFKISKSILKTLQILESIIFVFSKKEPVLSKALINSAYATQIYSNKKINTTSSVQLTPIKQVIERICSLYLLEKTNKN